MKAQQIVAGPVWTAIAVALIASLVLPTYVVVAQPRIEPPAAPQTGASQLSGEDISGAGVELTRSLFVPIAFRAPSAGLGARTAAVRSFQQEYLGTAGVDAGWTGSHASCTPGTTKSTFQNAVLRRINYFRSLAGVPATVSWNDGYSQKAQAAALLMSANGNLSHAPASNWTCFSSAAKDAAGSSDLSLGIYGPEAINVYMEDGGDNNYFVGHRRWILYPQTREMGTGDVPGTSSYESSNALWVFDGNFGSARPATRDGFVAWPPPGYIPYQIVYPRWSFSYPNANFASAKVTMSSGGKAISVALAPLANGFGENTLVWIPAGMNHSAAWPKPNADTKYTVTVSNVSIGGKARSFTYAVVIINP